MNKNVQTIKVNSRTVKDRSIGFRVAEWQWCAFKIIAERNDSTMSAMFDDWLMGVIKESGIKFEINIDVQSIEDL